MIVGIGQAPGKVILFGEHAVVYGRPALAVPISDVLATATVDFRPAGEGLEIFAQDTGQRWSPANAPANQPLCAICRAALSYLALGEPDWLVTIRSTIPVAEGLGSGAAVSTAIVRALARAAGRRLDPEEISRLVFEVEKLYHGNPSGIDNTVIAYRQPVFFRRDVLPEPFEISVPFKLAIAATGVAAPTREIVAGVAERRSADPVRFEELFDGMASLAEQARMLISRGEPERLGPLMGENQQLLRAIGVSSPIIERLISAAVGAGSAGAKLSGAGVGGNVIALVNEDNADAVEHALREAGARLVLICTVGE
jgi:mevalonate kinase